MTTHSILNEKLQALRAQIDEVVKELHDLTLGIPHEALAQTVSDLRNRINEPFMFVIVGEVKAGKSSFINALLDTGKEVTKVAPQPITDTIQQITYGPVEEVVVINPFLKRIHLPVEILREIAIVDTPGTNTIVEKHQEITEKFIPSADLIVFVFEAKNPYRQSSWDFFDFIHADWRKKIIFVLQQKDLLPEADLRINEEGVHSYAEKKGVIHPSIFSVSAKLELEGYKEASGFEPIRAYIRDNITGGQAPALKLRNNLDISRTIADKLREGLLTRRQQWVADTEFRGDIRETLEKQKAHSYRQVDILTENLLAAYDRITLDKESELSHGLSFFALLRRSIAGIFSKHASAREWLDNLAVDLGTELERELQKRLGDGVMDLAESIQQMAKVIDLKIQQSRTILAQNHEVFSAIAERRSNVLRDLQTSFTHFMNRSENFTANDLFPEGSPVSPNIVTGSGLAVVGAILAAVAQGAVFDITGGILTAVGLLFAGVSSSVKRRKILGGFQAEVHKGRTRMQEEVTETLKTYVDQLSRKIDQTFTDFDALLVQENDQLARLESIHEGIWNKLNRIAAEL